jgi:predicted Fe-Mo cluster-binding NifX family protein
MTRTGFVVSKKTPDCPLSRHFGMAKWVLVHDTETGERVFVRNEGLTGRAVVDIMAGQGCADAVFTSIGRGARTHLEDAGIRAWQGRPGVPVSELARLLSLGELEPAQAPDPARGRAGRASRSR